METSLGEFMAGATVIVSLMAAVLYGARFAAAARKGAVAAAVKTVSTAGLALAPALAGGSGVAGFWLIPSGLALGALGDLCLAQSGQRFFLMGVGAFGLGHLAYAGGFLWRSAALGLDADSAGEGLALAGLLLVLASTEVWLAPRTGRLRGAVRAYVALIGLMALAALLLPMAPGQAVLRAGAGLFVLSDLLLALELFVIRGTGLRRVLSLALWPAYWTGQAMIAWGALLFWAERQA
jgi:uncharacterized membrane protein YhhN